MRQLHRLFRSLSSLVQFNQRCSLILIGLLLSGNILASTGRGVIVRFEEKQDGGMSDYSVLPNFELYVPEGERPTPFLSDRPFRSEWRAEVRVPRRDSYRFTVESSGRVQLFIADKLIVESDGKKQRSEPVELGRGYNAIRLTLESPAKGDTYLRLRWESRDLVSGPLPERFLKYSSESAAFQHSQILRSGYRLYAEHRCGNCHDAAQPDSSLDRLEQMGPSLQAIGSRRHQQWLTDWLMDPTAHREEASMPDLLHGESESEQAKAIAAWLSTLRADREYVGSYRNGIPDSGAEWIESFHCAGCHKIPDKEAEGEDLISLEQLARKYPEGELVAFLLEPSRHFKGIRMPDFQFSVEEAEDIASYLIDSELESLTPPADSAVLIANGKELASAARCVHCHEIPGLMTGSSSNVTSQISISKWDSGCLAEGTKRNYVPAFQLTSEERQALQVFGKSGQRPAIDASAHEYARTQLENLNCQACHGKVELVPPLALLGEKLKPEWSASLLEGELFYKPRPWLDARMPAFRGRGVRIAEGLAMLNGFPPRTFSSESEQGVDEARAEIGKQLVSANGGLACVTCHAVGDSPATAVFESVGINFGYVNERLQRDFFDRWILKPTQIDPETKMPVYFFDGNTSPLTDVLDGDAHVQIEAMWEYFKQGFDIQAPQ